jgi:RNA polymerase sigma-70 factor (ECF subfamily)
VTLRPKRPGTYGVSVAASERLRIVSTLIRITGDKDLSEDCFQEVIARTLTVRPKRGIPDNPAAWITTVSMNLVLDALRRAWTERNTTKRYALEESPAAESGAEGRAESMSTADGSPLNDDRLRLIFTCCHPALDMDARVALTLRTVIGLSIGETGHAFLVAEQTMQKRLVRARAKIREAGIPYRVPPVELLPERTSGVLSVVYLLFTEGKSSGSCVEFMRSPLAEESIRLTRLLVILMRNSPQLPEVLGLLALELFQQSRAARSDRPPSHSRQLPTAGLARRSRIRSFAGSPTILIDGIDAFPDATPITELACRVYRTPSGFAGTPTIEELTRRISER